MGTYEVHKGFVRLIWGDCPPLNFLLFREFFAHGGLCYHAVPMADKPSTSRRILLPGMLLNTWLWVWGSFKVRGRSWGLGFDML